MKPNIMLEITFSKQLEAWQ